MNLLRVAFGRELMSSGKKRRSSSLYKTHPLYGVVVKNSFSIDLNRRSSTGITLYRIVFKVNVGLKFCASHRLIYSSVYTFLLVHFNTRNAI